MSHPRSLPNGTRPLGSINRKNSSEVQILLQTAKVFWICVFVSLGVVLNVYLGATGNVRLQLNKPWDSIAFYVFFTPGIAVTFCWAGFCIAIAVLLRKRDQAGLLQQAAALLVVAVPFWGIGYYDSIVRRLSESKNDRSQ